MEACCLNLKIYDKNMQRQWNSFEIFTLPTFLSSNLRDLTILLKPHEDQVTILYIGQLMHAVHVFIAIKNATKKKNELGLSKLTCYSICLV